MAESTMPQCSVVQAVPDDGIQTGPLVAERVRVRILEVPIASAVPMSFSALTARRMCIVEVHAGGYIGIGESWINYPNWAAEERVATVLQGAADIILGTDVSNPGATTGLLATRLRGIGRQWGAPGPIWQAISGIDLALWDLSGKVVGKPVHQLMNRNFSRSAVPAYASGIGPTDVVELCEHALQLGFEAVKAKVGFGRETDQATLETIREVCGDGIRIFADANQAWNLTEATDMSLLMIDRGIEWLEEPIDGNDLRQLEALHEATGLALATGENNYGEDQLLTYMRSPAIRHIQPDPAKSGGLTMARTIARAAAGTTCAVSPHWYGGAIGLAAAIHTGAAYSNVDWIEFDIRENPLRTDLSTNPSRLKDGSVLVPQAPGLAGELNDDVVTAYQIREAERSLT